MSEGQSYADRRQHKRVELSEPVKYTVIMPASENGMIRDISEGGLCMVVDRHLPANCTLHVEFTLPGDKPEHIEALGKVMWQRPLTDGKMSIGLKFIT